MISTTKKKLKNSSAYNHLIPKADLREITVKRGATLADTVRFIPKAVKMTRWQTEKLSKVLRGHNRYETCQNLWHFIYDHYAYEKDERGKEQIKSPRRLHHDKKGDCDCYSTFISTVLVNLEIPHAFRLAKYPARDLLSTPNFQHVYVIAWDEHGRPIVIDCVTDQFDYEVPYIEKKDIPMDLQFLDGIEGYPDNDFDISDMDEIEGLSGKLFKGKVFNKVKKKVKESVKKGLHVVNRVNPATVLLRNGVLLAMKINLMNVAGRIKWAYLTESAAQKRGIDMGKFRRLKTVREKLEKIFYGAGGKPENLKKAILEGKGNKNKAVHGLGSTDMCSSLRDILGDEIYYSENVDGMEGFEGFGSLGQLGEPISTGAAIAAASGAVTALAALIASIGNIFPKSKKGSEDFEKGDKGGSVTEVSPEDVAKMVETGVDDDITPEDSLLPTNNSIESSTPADNSGSGSETPSDPGAGFWERNKSWLKPSLIGATSLGALGLLYLGYKASQRGNRKSLKGVNGLDGIESLEGTPNAKTRKKNKQTKGKKRSNGGKRRKTAVALV